MVKITMEEFYTWRKEVINNLIEEVGDPSGIWAASGGMRKAIKNNSSCFGTYTAGSYVFVINARKKEVTMICMDDKRFTIARCDENKRFSAETAIAICYAKLKGWKIPF